MIILAECDEDRHPGGIWSCLDHIFLSETDAVILRAKLLSIAVRPHKIKEHTLSSNRHPFCPPDTAMMSIRITFCRYYHRYSISIESMITRRLFTADIESRYFFEAKWSQDFDSRHDFGKIGYFSLSQNHDMINHDKLSSTVLFFNYEWTLLKSWNQHKEE